MTGAPHLILVKHSLPAIEPGVAAAAWRLSAAGRARCRPLADALAPYRPDYLFASAEPKADETARLVAAQLGLPFAVAPDLHEHRRESVPWLDAGTFAAQVARCLAEPAALVMGEETADQAHRRFAGAVDALVAAHPNHTLAVVAHGTVISLYVARAAGCAPFPLWQQLGLPAFVVLSLPARAVVRVVAEVGAVAP